jgi:hypothetical protein
MITVSKARMKQACFSKPVKENSGARMATKRAATTSATTLGGRVLGFLGFLDFLGFPWFSRGVITLY